MTYIPFVYKWTELATGRWYIGSRTAKGCNPDDGYICSSKTINNSYNRISCRELWLTEAQYTFYLLLAQDKPYLNEYVVRSRGSHPEIDSDYINLAFSETYGSFY